MVYLLFIMKVFLKQRNMNETYRGGIGSFLLFNLLVAFFREHTKEVLRQNNNDASVFQNYSLSEYLMKFLLFYGNFDYKK